MIQKIYEVMKEIHDPEIPLNIVDLGLIKNIYVNDGEVNIVMTLTSPDCPLQELILETVSKKILNEVEGIKSVNISLDFTKTWTTNHISKEGKEKLKKLGWNF
ncbi:metal-sulfur cluster assembly factor [Sulfurihydrogenibium azorense]|jgi:metal-sulfur cluster biosynthetic enzyme|uniref:Putative mrp protein homolog n=2 Tax=Sulfurihydrogenibium azorense TaxID=309806 RepID=C1DXV5_SULAA|nr:metal-sulfur cluster assembly factor [Sulfurihydrogenibium azorense]ACN98191.1 putative mrp protein homolog [Sulfurihydrogenibium azorense Az-Fu1]MDM7273482.1 metal-sulfur cluster assembly factor [Sulfurihydrogenibium azorense]